MSERNCLKCKYCWVYSGSPGYGPETPGNDPEMHCSKGHWALNAFEYGRADVFAAFNTALTCPDYIEETP